MPLMVADIIIRFTKLQMGNILLCAQQREDQNIPIHGKISTIKDLMGRQKAEVAMRIKYIISSRIDQKQMKRIKKHNYVNCRRFV